MDTIYRGDVVSPGGRRNAWVDALLVDHAIFRLVWTNFAAVVPGRLYRSNHPTPGRLALAARRHGIRTIVNLRGQSGNGADALSRAAAQRLGLRLIDVPMKSSRAPSRALVLELIDALGCGEEPMLVHCKSGADRAGFAAGVFLLLHGATSADALRELSPRFGHFRASRTGILDAFFRRYRETGEGRMDFADWVRTEYDPETLRHDGPSNRIARVLNDFILRRE
jgi:protein tyrosine/serine phosphatase